MALTGEEIRANLTRFVARWSVREGNERSEAQTFLTELFECYGQRLSDVATFERFQAGGFVDLIWERVCIVEMKSASEARRLARHREQALNYWRQAADPDRNIPAPQYVVLCAFTRFEVWEPGRFPNEPRVTFDLEELPDRYTALLFLAGDEPVFTARQEAVTLDAVNKLAELFYELDARAEGEPDERRRFILQAVWCMFAEDLGQIPAHSFTRILDDLIANPQRSSADDLGRLFEYLNDPASQRPQHGLYAGVPYANGSLFANATRIDLSPSELELLREAANFNWREVQPSIFGSLLQSVFGREKQWQLGAHYTHEADIQKIVTPTIVRPWRERIEALSSYEEGRRAQADLMKYVVLDPACGSGNFLYVAYRELRRIEVALARRVEELARAEGRPGDQGALSAFFPLQNMRGIEIEQFGVDLARVTLWMGHRLAVEELDLPERTLPLANLSGIRRADALQVDWPAANAIIGNPPYHGSQNLRSVLDEDYVEWLKERFNVGLKDFCVYWFRRAADNMRPGDRAGLVGTNSISQNRARSASLNYVVEKGGVITDAVSKQRWPGEAVVNVSIVNWVHQPPEPPTSFTLDGEPVEGINTRLRESRVPIEEYERIPANAGRAFQGPIPAGSFYLTRDQARDLLARTDADYSKVVRPYLIGDDITEDPCQQPRRWIIDLGFMGLEEAMRFPAALEFVRTHVKPERDRNRDEGFRRYWWRFGRPRGEMRDALAPLSRFIAGNRIGKRFLFCWADSTVCPSDLTVVFAFDDDYSMGILTSSTHGAWAMSESSTLEDRPRYTPTSCFETFPWPQPDEGPRKEIGDISRRLIERRQAICVENNFGLTELYNQVDEGAWQEVAALHRELDVAVVRAYGWPAQSASDPLELKSRLAELHADIIAGRVEYAPFTTQDQLEQR